MPNWVKNTVALKGTKQQMTKLFSQVADVKTWEDVENKIGNLELTMRSFLPMPQTYLDWDTTNDMQTFECFCYGKNQPEEELRKEYENYVRGYRMLVSTNEKFMVMLVGMSTIVKHLVVSGMQTF